MIPKITLTYDNGLGGVSEVSFQSNTMLTRIGVEEWFYYTALQGIGFDRGAELAMDGGRKQND